MNTLSFTSLLTHSLAWALLYSLWQGLLVYGTLFVVLRALRDVSSRLKYFISIGAFTTMVAWFADTWITQYQKLKGITVYITNGSGVAAPLVTHQGVANPTINIADQSIIKNALTGMERYSSLIIAVYCAGLVLMLFRFAVNLWQVRMLKKSGVVAPQEHLNDLVAQWQEQFNISRPVKLLLSAKVDVPMMLGILKPVILLPVATINHLSVDQLEAILVHELAHIKRQDFLFNIFQTIVETVLFFNPFIWLISAIIRKERENCCDDMVVASTTDPMPYARALAILETNRYEANLALAVTGRNKKQLFNRIKRIMEMKKQNINYSQLGIAAMIIITIVFSLAIFTPSFAQKNKLKKDDADSSKTTRSYSYKKVIVDNNGDRREVNKTVNTNSQTDVEVSFNDENVSGDFGKAITDIVKAATEIAVSVTKLDDVDVEKEMAQARKEMESARKEMRAAKREMRSAQKEIDAVDWDQVRAEINKGLAEANKALNDPELKKEISLEIRRGIEEGKAALEQTRAELQRQRIDLSVTKDEDEHVTKSSENDFDEMLDKMENEGLINRNKGFNIVKSENGTLVINSEVQSGSVYNRYKQYLDANNIVISGKKGKLSITVNN